VTKERDNLKSQVQDLQGQLSSLQAQIAQLQSQLQAMQASGVGREEVTRSLLVGLVAGILLGAGIGILLRPKKEEQKQTK